MQTEAFSLYLQWKCLEQFEPYRGRDVNLFVEYGTKLCLTFLFLVLTVPSNRDFWYRTHSLVQSINFRCGSFHVMCSSGFLLVNRTVAIKISSPSINHLFRWRISLPEDTSDRFLWASHASMLDVLRCDKNKMLSSPSCHYKGFKVNGNLIHILIDVSWIQMFTLNLFCLLFSMVYLFFSTNKTFRVIRDSFRSRNAGTPWIIQRHNRNFLTFFLSSREYNTKA